MNTQDILNARDPDLRSSAAALRRASALARKAAIQTGTDIVVVKDGQLIVIEAKTLREQAQTEDAPTQ